MCLLCDLDDISSRGEKAKKQAQEYVKDIIRSAEVIARKYRLVLKGKIKPHTHELEEER